MDMTLNIVDRILAEAIFESEEFEEFSRNLCLLDKLTNDNIYLSEKIDGSGAGITDPTIAKIIANTTDTTRDILKVSKLTTDAGGAAIKSVWDLIMKLVHLASKILVFVVKKIVKIPELIGKIIDTITKIPTTIKNRIRGNIELFVTIEDIQMLMNNIIINHLMTFIGLAYKLSQGEMWSTLFHKDSSRVNISDNDMKIISSMKKEFKIFKKLRFSKTVVDMNDPNTVEGYFGKGVISYRDMYGNEHKETYYGSLKELIQVISTNKTTLDRLYTAIGDKFSNSQSSTNFAELNSIQRNNVVDSITMMSATIQILGNLMRCIVTDMNTIQKTTDQIMNRKAKIDAGKAKKKLVGMKDSVAKDLDINDEPNGDIQYYKNMRNQGYVRVNKYIKDKSGMVLKTIQGVEDPNNKEAVWVKSDNVPKGAKKV